MILVGSGDLLWGGADCINHPEGQKWAIWVNFLQISQIICLQMENFFVVILYLVYFTLKHMYFEDLWVKSREFPEMKMQIVRNLNFRKFMNNDWERDGSLRISENEDYKS